jgi:glycosyltransferase involved in cell wall biosynthesis
VGAFVENPHHRWFSLGRHRKINQVTSMLSSFGFEIIRLNIAPHFQSSKPLSVIPLCQSSNIPARFIQLIVSSYCFFVSAAGVNHSSILWLYNSRSAEAIVAIVALFLRPRLRLVLQLEDLPSARLENHGIAGTIDLLMSILISKRADQIFAVSDSVASAYASLTRTSKNNIKILPPALDPLYIKAVRYRLEPFSLDTTVILYAGSYQEDKGVLDLIRAFIEITDKSFQLQLFGSAPTSLIDSFSRYDRIIFKGVVTLDVLFNHYASADVVVNPHRPILNSNYVFPFKLVEIIASGALPLTTPVPGSEAFELPQDCLFKSVDQLSQKLASSKSLWRHNRKEIIACASLCREKYCTETIQSELAGLIRQKF